MVYTIDIRLHVLTLLPPFSPVLGLVTSCLVSLLWLSPLLKQPNVPYDVIGVALFSVSAITELVAEPLWVMGQAARCHTGTTMSG